MLGILSIIDFINVRNYCAYKSFVEWCFLFLCYASYTYYVLTFNVINIRGLMEK